MERRKIKQKALLPVGTVGTVADFAQSIPAEIVGVDFAQNNSAEVAEVDFAQSTLAEIAGAGFALNNPDEVAAAAVAAVGPFGTIKTSVAVLDLAESHQQSVLAIGKPITEIIYINQF